MITEWLEHFIKYAKPTKSNKVLLLLKGHTRFESGSGEWCNHVVTATSYYPSYTRPLQLALYHPGEDLLQLTDRTMDQRKTRAEAVIMYEIRELYWTDLYHYC